MRLIHKTYQNNYPNLIRNFLPRLSDFFSFIFSPITSWIFRRTAAAFMYAKKYFLPLHFYAVLPLCIFKYTKNKVNTHVCMYSGYKASSSYYSLYYLLYVLISISPLLPQQYNPLITKSASGIFFFAIRNIIIIIAVYRNSCSLNRPFYFSLWLNNYAAASWFYLFFLCGDFFLCVH